MVKELCRADTLLQYSAYINDVDVLKLSVFFYSLLLFSQSPIFKYRQSHEATDIKYLGYEGRKSAIYSKPLPKKTDSLAVHGPSVTLLTYKHNHYAK